MLDMSIRPSDLMGIKDSYTAFCFDEACAFIVSQIKEGRNPVFKSGIKEDGIVKEYSKPSDIYKKFNN